MKFLKISLAEEEEDDEKSFVSHAKPMITHKNNKNDLWQITIFIFLNGDQIVIERKKSLLFLFCQMECE